MDVVKPKARRSRRYVLYRNICDLIENVFYDINTEIMESVRGHYVVETFYNSCHDLIR